MLKCAHIVGQLACRLRVIIEDTAGRAAGQSDLTLTVSGELQNASLVLAFSEGETEDASNETLHYPMTLSTTSATLDPSQTLKVGLQRLTAHSLQQDGIQAVFGCAMWQTTPGYYMPASLATLACS